MASKGLTRFHALEPASGMLFATLGPFLQVIGDSAMNFWMLLAQDDVAAPVLVGGGMMLVIALLGIVALVLWIWALIDAIRIRLFRVMSA